MVSTSPLQGCGCRRTPFSSQLRIRATKTIVPGIDETSSSGLRVNDCDKADIREIELARIDDFDRDHLMTTPGGAYRPFP